MFHVRNERYSVMSMNLLFFKILDYKVHLELLSQLINVDLLRLNSTCPPQRLYFLIILFILHISLVQLLINLSDAQESLGIPLDASPTLVTYPALRMISFRLVSLPFSATQKTLLLGGPLLLRQVHNLYMRASILGPDADTRRRAHQPIAFQHFIFLELLRALPVHVS